MTSREEGILTGEVLQKRRIQILVNLMTYKLAMDVADLALMKM